MTRLLVLEAFENERLPKIVPAAFGKMGFKGTLDLPTMKSMIEATKSYGHEMKKTFNLPRRSCTWREPRSGFFLLSSQGTYTCSVLMFNVNSVLHY